MIFPIKRLADLGFAILATSGTAEVLRHNGVEAEVIRKLWELPATEQPGDGPHDGSPVRHRSGIVARILDGDVDLVVNTPHGTTSSGNPRLDGYEIRSAAVARNIPCITTVQGLAAAVQGIEALLAGDVGVRSLQDWAAHVRAPGAALPPGRGEQ